MWFFRFRDQTNLFSRILILHTQVITELTNTVSRLVAKNKNSQILTDINKIPKMTKTITIYLKTNSSPRQRRHFVAGQLESLVFIISKETSYVSKTIL